MSPLHLLAALLAQPADPPANAENIAAALRLTQAAAAEYAITAGNDETPFDLVKEPVLKWSNPDRGEVHGNVFVWTRNGRPRAVGSLFKWFRPWTHMSHEFQSLAEGPVRASFHDKPVWNATAAGVTFSDIPGAPAPAAADAARQTQLRQLAREFAGAKTERDDKLVGDTGNVVELRLLPQPVHKYADPKQGVAAGGLFAFVHGTDPEIWLLIEAREGVWQWAAARMNGCELRLRHRVKPVWKADVMPWADIQTHTRPYTTFGFKEIPEFLRGADAPVKK